MIKKSIIVIITAIVSLQIVFATINITTNFGMYIEFGEDYSNYTKSISQIEYIGNNIVIPDKSDINTNNVSYIFDFNLTDYNNQTQVKIIEGSSSNILCSSGLNTLGGKECVINYDDTYISSEHNLNFQLCNEGDVCKTFPIAFPFQQLNNADRINSGFFISFGKDHSTYSKSISQLDYIGENIIFPEISNTSTDIVKYKFDFNLTEYNNQTQVKIIEGSISNVLCSSVLNTLEEKECIINYDDTYISSEHNLNFQLCNGIDVCKTSPITFPFQQLDNVDIINSGFFISFGKDFNGTNITFPIISEDSSSYNANNFIFPSNSNFGVIISMFFIVIGIIFN